MILLVLGVLLAGEVGAGGTVEITSQYPLPLVSCVDEKGKTKCVVPLDPCLAQMEAAMRAMEPFNWNNFERTWHRAAADEKEHEFRENKEAALKLWNDTKAQCWRK